MNKKTTALFAAFVLLFSLVAESQSKPLKLMIPGRKGAIEFVPGDLQLSSIELNGGGRQMRIEAKSPSGMFVTGFVEIAPKPGTADDVRNLWWGEVKAASKLPMTQIELGKMGEASTVEYMFETVQGIPLKQKNLHAYYGGDEIWTELHASKIQFKPEDEQEFQRLAQSVHYMPAYVQNSTDYFLFGNLVYMQKDFKNAAPLYQKAFDLDEANSTLGDTYWHVMVDNLGMAYGMSGDLEKARNVFEAGIAKDPKYPLFEYNMACYYGEKKDEANALLHLKKAFALKDNTLPGESMPDPLQDDSFRSFKKDKAFREAVKSLQAQ